MIDLGMGEPDFDTPRHVIEAANKAAKLGYTRYTATGGAPATKAAVIEKFKRDNGLEFSMDEIIVSNGAKQVIFNVLMATLESNDEVFTKFLLDEARIAAVPGSAYGLSPYFRISTAASDDSLLAAINRIEAAIDRLEPNHT